MLFRSDVQAFNPVFDVTPADLIDVIVTEKGVIEREKGYSNNPADAGGETMWGITVATARRLGYTGPMRDLPRDTAAAIYMREYVTAPGFGRIAVTSMPVAVAVRVGVG